MSYDEPQPRSVDESTRVTVAADPMPTFLQLWIEGVEPALSVRRVSIREQLLDVFSLSIVACSPRQDLDLEAMLFRPASFWLMAGRALLQASDGRLYTGICASVE